MSDADEIGAKAAITNIFVLMLENHSFDNMLGRSGIPGLRVAPANGGNPGYPVFSPAPWCMTTDPGHEFPDVIEQLCGAAAAKAYLGNCDKTQVINPKCAGCHYPAIDGSGFASSYATSVSEDTGTPAPDHVRDIVGLFDTPRQLPVLNQLANEFAVCDAWHASMPGPTWPNRFFVHGGSSAGMDISPVLKEEAPWETLKGFQYAHKSIYHALKAHGHKFRLYQDKMNAFSDNPSHWDQGGWISQVASLEGLNLADIESLSWFEHDLNQTFGSEPTYTRYPYTFIEPNFGASFFSPQPGGGKGPRYKGGSSQHPEDDCYGGEALIKFVYEKIRASPIWNTSLLVIVYDEHGGFYDSLPPTLGTAPAPGDPTPGGQEKLNQYCCDFKTYGVRVPAVIVSPWVQKNTVDHTLYDHTSILATLERKLGMPALTARDGQAADLWNVLNAPTPRTDCPTTLVEPVKPPPGYDSPITAATVSADNALPPEGNAIGFLHVLLKTELDLAARPAGEIAIDFRKIVTHADACAYVVRVKALIEGAGRAWQGP